MYTFLITLAISALCIYFGLSNINEAWGKKAGLIMGSFILVGLMGLLFIYTQNVVNRTLGEPKVTKVQCGTADYIKQGIKTLTEKALEEYENFKKQEAKRTMEK